jgi:integrase
MSSGTRTFHGLVMAGVDIRTVQELAGHKSISMTVRYSDLSPDHKLSAVAVLAEFRKLNSAGSKVVTFSARFGASP